MPEDLFVVAVVFSSTAVPELPSLLFELRALEKVCVLASLVDRQWCLDSLRHFSLEGEWELRVAESEMVLAPNSLVLLPRERLIRVVGPRLKFGDRSEPADLDLFLESLAEARGSRAAALLENHDSLIMPTRGAEAVREQAGLVVELSEPGWSSTAVDLLETHFRQSTSDIFWGREGELAAVMDTLVASTGVDFSSYKPSTVRRRIDRRMTARHLLDLTGYVELLRREPEEVEALYSELLVGVTELFRDMDVFSELRSAIFPALIQQRQDDRPIRIWVPGCSRGDEAYSIAICGLEAMRGLEETARLQIFATDLNERALIQARAGRYPISVVENLPDWARHHFIKRSQGYQISRTVREMCIFARQDVTKDPPFSRLDLISCRNLLIYLSLPSQRRTLQHFHYALKPGGFLLLGASEYLGDCESLFEPFDKKNKIFRRRMSAVSTPLYFSSLPSQIESTSPQSEVPSSMETPVPEHDIGKYADRMILGRYTPSGVVVDESFNILSFRGRTGGFLEPPEGAATFNLLKMAREGLLAALRFALPEALSTQRAVRCDNLRVRDGDHLRELSLEVLPVKLHEEQAANCLLVVFLEKESSPQPETSLELDESELSEINYLRHELRATRDYLSAIIWEREASNEELRAANEEAQSANEELQSANEELETAKEELQSTNEELATINEELHERNLELQSANSDLNNILSSLDSPMVILDRDLCIQRFTPSAQSLLNLIPSDVGRPLEDLRCEVEIPELAELVREVLTTLQPKEFARESVDGREFLVRLRPYRRLEGESDRVVLSFTDVTLPRDGPAGRKEEPELAPWLLQAFPHPAALYDGELNLVAANTRFEQSLAQGGFDLDARIRELLQTLLKSKSQCPDSPKSELALDGSYRLSVTFYQHGPTPTVLLLELAEAHEPEREEVLS